MVKKAPQNKKRNRERARLSGKKTQLLLKVVNKRVLHILSAKKKKKGDFKELNL